MQPKQQQKNKQRSDGRPVAPGAEDLAVEKAREEKRERYWDDCERGF